MRRSPGENGHGPRVLVIAATAVVLAVVALVIATYGRPSTLVPTPSPTASRTPPGATSTAAATSTPAGSSTPSISPTGAVEGYGYVLATHTSEEQRIVIRRESDGSVAFDLDGALPAVSRDGRRLAYWRSTPGLGPTDLRVIELASPTSDRSVFTVNDDSLGGSVVWSNDGQGLLVTTYSRRTTGGGGIEGAAPARYDLLMVDLGTSPPSARPAAQPVTGGRVFIPVGWDRPGKAAAGVVTGPGGYAIEYATWNGNASEPLGFTEIPRPLLLAESVHASDDAKLVLGVQDDLTVVRVWPLLDVAKADEVRAATVLTGYPLWRPAAAGSYEVFWLPYRRIDLFRYRSDQSATLFSSDEGVTLVATRPDGSAVLIVVRAVDQPPPLPAGRLLLLDVATKQTSALATLSTPLGGSTRLLPREVVLR